MRRSILLLLTLFLLGGLFTACGSEKGKQGKGSLYGTWKVTGRNHYVFAKDGSFTDKDTMDATLTERGTFTLDKELLVITVGPAKKVFKIMSITSDLAKMRPIRNGKESSSHNRWERE